MIEELIKMRKSSFSAKAIVELMFNGLKEIEKKSEFYSEKINKKISELEKEYKHIHENSEDMTVRQIDEHTTKMANIFKTIQIYGIIDDIKKTVQTVENTLLDETVGNMTKLHPIQIVQLFNRSFISMIFESLVNTPPENVENLAEQYASGFMNLAEIEDIDLGLFMFLIQHIIYKKENEEFKNTEGV